MLENHHHSSLGSVLTKYNGILVEVMGKCWLPEINSIYHQVAEIDPDKTQTASQCYLD